MPRNLDYLREKDPRLFEVISDLLQQQQNIAQQVNANSTGEPLPPPPIDALNVTGQNGKFHLQIQHDAEIYRGIRYYAEYADNPGFQNPHAVYMGDVREHTLDLGNGTYYFRARAAYGSSPPSRPAYHGGADPQPVSGGGIIGGPALLDPQGSGTGKPGEPAGPGPVPFRSRTGAAPIRGETTASGGSGSAPSAGPSVGLPPGAVPVTPTPADGGSLNDLVRGGAVLTHAGAIPKVSAAGTLAESSLSDDGAAVKSALPVRIKTGGVLESVGADNVVLAAGAYYDGANWIALAASAAMIVMSGGVCTIYSATGLTPGVAFAFVQRLNVDLAGKVDASGDIDTATLYRVGGVAGVNAAHSVVVSAALSFTTIQYKDWAGANQSISVATGISVVTALRAWTKGILTT